MMANLSLKLIVLILLAIIVEINCGIHLTEINGNRNTENFNTDVIGGVIHCGVITCPQGTNCVITQNRDNNDSTKVVITQTCYDNDSMQNAVKQNHVTVNANESQGDVNIVHKQKKGWLW